jgi:hypothetical protein
MVTDFALFRLDASAISGSACRVGRLAGTTAPRYRRRNSRKPELEGAKYLPKYHAK